MKLERNNKYGKSIALGLTTLVFSSMLVSPKYVMPDNTTEVVNPNRIVTCSYETVPNVTTNVDDTYLTEDQINSLLSLLDIKDPDYSEPVNYNVLVKFYNSNNDYKVAVVKPSIVNYDGDPDDYVGMYDTFTDELLFVTAYNKESTLDGAAGELGIDFSNIVYVGKCMDKAKSVKVDYFTSMIDMALEEKHYSKERILEYVPETFDTGTYEATTLKIAKMYVDFVPMEYQISSNEIINGFEQVKIYHI